MGVKRPRVLALYGSTSAAAADTPSAAMDAYILAASRNILRRRPRGLPLLTAAFVAIAALAIGVRWFTPGRTAHDTRDFGLAEGQAGAYLATLDITSNYGPGSQEGLP